MPTAKQQMEGTYDMNKWTEFSMRIQSIAQAGLAYGENAYDRERYEELRSIAAEMISCETDMPVEKVTAAQIVLCFEAYDAGKNWVTRFD